MTLAQQRCHNHETREAVACCPECRNFFCRECIAEHEQRVLCAACLKKSGGTKKAPSRFRLPLWRAAQFLAALFILWVSFYFMGRTLLSLPSSLHEGTLWTESWWDTVDR